MNRGPNLLNLNVSPDWLAASRKRFVNHKLYGAAFDASISKNAVTGVLGQNDDDVVAP